MVSRRLLVTAYNIVRVPLSRVIDPVIPYRLEGRTLRLPWSHDLPVIRYLFPTYGSSFAAVAEAVGPGPMVDVGANVGDTAIVMLAHGATRVFAVEPSARYRKLLQRNVPEAIVSDALLGPAGTGTVVARRGSAETVRGDVPMRRPSEVLPEDFAPVLVKTDTDGMDQAILLADLDWLADVRPALFVEYAPDLTPDGAAGFFAAMRDAGYGWLLWYDEQGRFLASTTPSDERIVDDLAGHFRGGGYRHYADVAMLTDEATWSAARHATFRK